MKTVAEVIGGCRGATGLSNFPAFAPPDPSGHVPSATVPCTIITNVVESHR